MLYYQAHNNDNRVRSASSQTIAAASLLLSLAVLLAGPFALLRWLATATYTTQTQSAFLQTSSSSPPSAASPSSHANGVVVLHGWLDGFLPKPLLDDDNNDKADTKRRLRYPEQYPATYELLETTIDSNNQFSSPDVRLVRPLLKVTQLEHRSLEVAYDAVIHG